MIEDANIIAHQVVASKAKIEEIKAKIESLRFDLAVEEAVIVRLQSIKLNPAAHQVVSQIESRGQSGVAGNSLAEQAATILRERGKPMQAAEISRALVQRGVTTTSKAGMNSMVLSGIRRRSDLFRRVGRGRYTLKLDHESEDK